MKIAKRYGVWVLNALVEQATYTPQQPELENIYEFDYDMTPTP